jgi:hypothetical protein
MGNISVGLISKQFCAGSRRLQRDELETDVALSRVDLSFVLSRSGATDTDSPLATNIIVPNHAEPCEAAYQGLDCRISNEEATSDCSRSPRRRRPDTSQFQEPLFEPHLSSTYFLDAIPWSCTLGPGFRFTGLARHGRLKSIVA